MKNENNQRSKARARNIVLIVIVSVIVLSNTPPAAFFLQPAYHYQTKDGAFSFTEEPGKAMDYEVLRIRYNRYLHENPGAKEKQLYRTFRFKAWQFWQWWEMAVRNERFRLPYLAVSETR